MKVRFSFFSIVILAAILTGCNHNVEQEKIYEFTINVRSDINSGMSNILNEAYGKETGLVERTAIPETPSAVYYKVTASKTGHAAVESEWEGGDKYSIRLSEGEWSLVAKGYSTNTDGVFSNQVFENNSITLTVNDSLNNSTTPLDIVVYPVLTADAGETNEKSTGYVELPFSIAPDSGIVSAIAAWDGQSQNFTFSSTKTSEVLYMGNIPNTEIPTGAHSVSFSFFKEDNAGNEYLCYYFTETVNVFANLKTTKWVKASERSSYMDADGNIVITRNLVAAFEKNTFYVDGTNGNNSASGSFFNPFKTIQKAIDVIEVMNSGAADEKYSIVLKSDVNELVTAASYTTANNQAYINIDPSQNLNLSLFSYGTDIKAINAKRTAAATGRVMYIGSSADVTLQNVILTGGYLASGNGAGIDVEGSLSIEGGIAVYGNKVGTADNNIYLPKNADDTQKVITILGALSSCSVTEGETSVVRKTGIKIAEAPVYDLPSVAFTSGFTSKSNSSTPSAFFVSDDDYAVGLKTGEAVIAVTKLSVTPEIMKNVQLSVTGSTNIVQANGGIITLSAKSGEIDVTDSITQWSISVTNGGGTVTVTEEAADPEIGDSSTVSTYGNKIVFHRGLPKGSYQVMVTAAYTVSGQTQGAKDGLTFDVEIQ